MERMPEEALAALRKFRQMQSEADGLVDEESGLTVVDLNIAVYALELFVEWLAQPTVEELGDEA